MKKYIFLIFITILNSLLLHYLAFLSGIRINSQKSIKKYNYNFLSSNKIQNFIKNSLKSLTINPIINRTISKKVL
ncbi:hypothetical protein DU474_02400 [Campylobacter novaezeelandiae]|uniref:Uncharacterized protein n=1 Tax=Campylobacter novaezeelandiae TaxID=2267891 RepID=A0A4Q9JUK4_9BACT|nr:hypothetical protein DU474_02400 [Campylobacter novaezeelandiae]TBR81116.1 hypothetical protein DU473_04760 [Campylobacter novaezeelandiae]